MEFPGDGGASWGPNGVVENRGGDGETLASSEAIRANGQNTLWWTPTVSPKAFTPGASVTGAQSLIRLFNQFHVEDQTNETEPRVVA